jgi:hypothetical protein
MIPWEITKYITNPCMGTIWPALHHEIRTTPGEYRRKRTKHFNLQKE